MKEYLNRNNFSKYLIEPTLPLPQIDCETVNTVLETISETELTVLEKPNNVGLNRSKPFYLSEKSNGICLYCQKKIINPRKNKFFCNASCRTTYGNDKKLNKEFNSISTIKDKIL